MRGGGKSRNILQFKLFLRVEHRLLLGVIFTKSTKGRYRNIVTFNL